MAFTDRELTQLQETGSLPVDGYILTELIDAADKLGFNPDELFVIAIGDVTYLEVAHKAMLRKRSLADAWPPQPETAEDIARRMIPVLARNVGVTT